MDENGASGGSDDINISVQISPGSEYFDRAIGFIEDIVVEENFRNLQHDFLEEHWQAFENTEENKFEYMEIFNEYTNLMESYINCELKERMDDFDMELFCTELQEKKPQLEGEIFDLILSLLDFCVFKELMLDYRAEKEGRFENIEFDITVTKIPNQANDNNEPNDYKEPNNHIE